VFGLSLNLLDRFLACTMNVKRSRLQLVASACLFTASKIKETTARLTGNKLIVYTDYSITLQELLVSSNLWPSLHKCNLLSHLCTLEIT